MSFFRVSNPEAVDFIISDLGIIVEASAVNEVLSNQFSVNDLYLSADLELAIQNEDLTVQIDYGNGFESVAAVDYTNRDTLSSFLNIFEISNENDNEELVGGEDTSLHKHDNFYYTKSEIGAITGAALVGLDAGDFEFLPDNLDDVQDFASAVDVALKDFAESIDLDVAYSNDDDGILNVNGTSKPLDLRSNNTNNVKISRTDETDVQNLLATDVSGNELVLGAAVEGGLGQVDVRVLTNLIIDGDLTLTGTLTDTTVDELNVTNANIRLRDGADDIAGADAYIEVERGTSGNDARLQWSESDDRWLAGIVGDLNTIALLEKHEVVTGVWEFQGGGSTEPSAYLTNKASAPTTELGSASQSPVSVINGILSVYDKTNSRDKWLSIHRNILSFVGRDNPNNRNEYARFVGGFTSNQSSAKLLHNSTLLGISIQTNGNATWNARVRKNGSVTDLATLTSTASSGEIVNSLNLDFNEGDVIEVYIDGNNVDRPVINLELAQRF